MKSFLPVASLLVFALLSFGLPAQSQYAQPGYHYSHGGSRVINQHNIGLYMPAATQIGGGTISKSAQGIMQSGEQINPGLPKVPMGSHVGTAGDAEYAKNFTPSQQTIVFPDQAGGGGTVYAAPAQGGGAPYGPPSAIPGNRSLPGVRYGSYVGTAGDAMRSDLHPEVNNQNDAWWHPQQGQQRSMMQPTQTYHPPVSIPDTYNDGQTHKINY